MAVDTESQPGQLTRLDALFEQLAELQGQRNAIDARIVDVVQQLEDGELWGVTGCRSLEHCVAWKTGSSPAHARALSAVARRADSFPSCVKGLRSGSLSLDQVAVIAERAADGSDAHYAELAESATVAQLRTALRLAPKPRDDQGRPMPERSVTKITDDEFAHWRIKLPHVDAAIFDAALQSHLDALVAAWQLDHDDRDDAPATAPPFPTVADAFLRLVEHGWDADVAARPHGHRTTVVVHLDAESKAGSLHLGPMLSEAERRYLSCDSVIETWLEQDGVPIGSARETRQISRRLRRALEFRDPVCAVPGCGATRALHGHHIWHWEDGGPTELWNLVLVCPFHHRSHHRGLITIRGPGDAVRVTDAAGRPITGSSVARPPTRPPPVVPPYAGPTGERADWRWYQPFEPEPSDN
jgi:hypothetical protein